jgi:hypothetical protein
MIKKIIFLTSFFLGFNASVQALGPTDRVILRDVIPKCNGESQGCKDAYKIAIQITEDSGPGITF